MIALSEFELDIVGLGSFVYAMREVAQADGEEHPDELELINSLLAEGPDLQGQTIPERFDARSLIEEEVKAAFLVVLSLVAVVDGAVQESERAVIQKYADELGLSEHVDGYIRSAALWLLSTFHSVEIFRDELIDFGEGLGLTRAEIIEHFDELPSA